MKITQRYSVNSILLLITVFIFSSVQSQDLTPLVKEEFIQSTENPINAVLLKQFRKKSNLYIHTENLQQIRKDFPEDIKLSVQVADQVSQKYFLFRYEWDMEKTNIPYQFDKEIDWKIIPFGDSEWCYMLNRHKYWIDLGKAYRFTGNEKYARVWVQQVTDWIKKNKVEDVSLRRLSWRRIEAGIRCENWIKSFEYFKNSKQITPEFLAMFLHSLYEHAEYINKNFSDFSKTSNWGILEYHGLLNVALFMPEFKQAETWKNDAVRKLDICASLQVLPDGTQWEQSPMYHNEVLHCLMNSCYLAQRNNTELPLSMIAHTKALVQANIRWMKPNFHQPLTGDSDDSDLSSMLTTAAMVFQTDSFKMGKNSVCDYENAFHFSSKEQLKFNAMKQFVPDFTTTYLQSSGDFVMRNNWESDSPYMLMRLKKLACGHAHDDVLHLSLFAHGKDYLVDGGRYTYTETPERQWLKSSRGHNVPVVDGQTHSVYEESWSNSFNNSSRNVKTQTNKLYDYASADMMGYMRLQNPVLVNRKVIYMKPGLWLVLDNFYGNSKHTYDQTYHFADTKVKMLTDGVSTDYESKNLKIQTLKEVQIKMDTTIWSPEYNLKKKNAEVTFKIDGNGFAGMINAIYFPEETSFNYRFLPVTDRDGRKITAEFAEALEFNYNGKQFILFVLHQSPAGMKPFFKINNEFVTGNVVLMEKKGNTLVRHLIEE